MDTIDLFSKRQKALRGDAPDVYVYNALPKPLRVQIINVWRAAIGDATGAGATSRPASYQLIVEILCDEYGQFRLAKMDEQFGRYYQGEMESFLLTEPVVDRALDAVELAFRFIDTTTREPRYLNRRDASEVADDAIAKLNIRFKEHGVGYQYEDRNIMRVDSELLHGEVVKPALLLLKEPYLSGAQQEFLTAHRHFRSGNSKEALTECRKAFESVMKSICDKRGWTYDKGRATAKDLIQVCLDKGLIPSFWQTNFASIRTLLESSVPTGGNKLSAHGQGSVPTKVPEYIVAYMLHMTASAVVFLAEAEAALPR